MTSATPNAPGVDPFFFGDRVGRGQLGHDSAMLGSAPAPTEHRAASGRARQAPSAGPVPPGPAAKRRKQWGGDRPHPGDADGAPSR
jgi:hypothetical protein